jgi:hypothetical protein
MSAAYVCFSLAALIALGMWRYSQTDDEPALEPIKVPDPITIVEDRPNLRNGDRVFVQLGIEHIPSSPAARIISVACEQISLWVLCLQKTDEAFSSEQYAKLRSFRRPPDAKKICPRSSGLNELT